MYLFMYTSVSERMCVWLRHLPVVAHDCIALVAPRPGFSQQALEVHVEGALWGAVACWTSHLEKPQRTSHIDLPHISIRRGWGVLCRAALLAPLVRGAGAASPVPSAQYHRIACPCSHSRRGYAPVVYTMGQAMHVGLGSSSATARVGLPPAITGAQPVRRLRAAECAWGGPQRSRARRPQLGSRGNRGCGRARGLNATAALQRSTFRRMALLCLCVRLRVPVVASRVKFP